VPGRAARQFLTRPPLWRVFGWLNLPWGKREHNE
jgi:hypothetical protein